MISISTTIVISDSSWQVPLLHPDTGKIVLYVAIGIIALLFLGFVIHTLRCYLNRPDAD